MAGRGGAWVADTAETGQPDFSARLHALRGAELGRLPEGAATILHGGAAGAWYFDWFDEHYPGEVQRHIGVEAFAERPSDLPSHVEWLQRTLGNMDSVPSGSVDMVFGGQVVEHLWAEDVAGFLTESRRVLREDGLLVLDSPNRRVTEAIAWHQPEHTVEFSVDEIATLLELSGFALQELRGVMLGYDRERHFFLELEDTRMPWTERATLAADRPEDSFVWWLTARPAARQPEQERLTSLANTYADEFRARRLRRLVSSLPVRRATGCVPAVSSPRGHAGPLILAPASPFAAGSWRFAVALRLEDAELPADLPVAAIEAATADASHGRREVLAGELDPAGTWTSVELGFDLDRMVMGLELRADAHPQAVIGAQLDLSVGRQSDAPTPTRASRPDPPAHVPEPRTVEIIEMLGRRAAHKARRRLARPR
jgi:SAM-dependent methyltransferase